MKCKVCGAESGKYPLCHSCNLKKEKGEIIKCTSCGNWHYINTPCSISSPTPNGDTFLYEAKNKLITMSEQGYYIAIKDSVPEGYCVFPQINLASFISKTDNTRFQNELFRNVDFLITDAEYTPKIVIEINDQSHLTKERSERDEKVKKICEEAGIPLIKLWTSYGISPEYIKNRINETLAMMPIERIHHFTQTTPQPTVPPQQQPQTKKWCYVATCVYGSYDCPEVWVLRRYRDKVLDTNWSGKLFINCYYAISPFIVKKFGKSPWFIKTTKRVLNKLVAKLQNKGFENTPYDDNY